MLNNLNKFITFKYSFIYFAKKKKLLSLYIKKSLKISYF